MSLDCYLTFTIATLILLVIRIFHRSGGTLLMGAGAAAAATRN